MAEGRIESIHIATAAGSPMQSKVEVSVTAGAGIDGDRYAAQVGKFSDKPKSGRQITFIEAEAIEALATELGITLQAGETRRNVVTRGVPLNHLVGREFEAGSVRFRGTELCEPCQYLTELTGKPGILPGLTHRGGLRAEVLQGGLLSLGDTLTF
ncbi:MAG: MOSC domain-containing protein [Geothrix sp.]|nr:MOSC domain-containing protein [Acidobacteriota bacterium]